jgi:DNA invertase Pin-like site-specific DNA recombinase
VESISDAIDSATSTGRLMLNMLATLAEYEREVNEDERAPTSGAEDRHLLL